MRRIDSYRTKQDDPSVRPAISGEVEDMEHYDVVLIGHPIWHGQAPRIISTFLESYDFSGKTLVTTCGSSAAFCSSFMSNDFDLSVQAHCKVYHI